MSKSTIIAIVGPSGAGKTLAAEYLKEEGIPSLVSYTTRPMRPGETDGVEHYFVDESCVPYGHQRLAYTVFGGYKYWVRTSQVPSEGKCVYVIDEKGLLDLAFSHGRKYNIIPVLVKRDLEKLKESVQQERIDRDLERYRLKDSDYQFIIENNGSVEEFKDKLVLMIENIENGSAER